MAEHGVKFGKPKVDLDALRGLEGIGRRQADRRPAGLAKQRKVEVVHRRGVASTGPNTRARSATGRSRSSNCIIAAGSEAASMPGAARRRPRIFSSTGALELPLVPKRLLVVGGGIIGLEMATVYDALGSKVTMVELLDQLIPGCDPDLVKPLHKRISERYEAIHLGTKVESVEASASGLAVEAVVRRHEDVRRRSWSRSAARPNGGRRSRRGRRRRRRRRLHPGRPADAHQRAAHLRDRRHRRRPDARAQGLARGQGGRRGHRRRSGRRVRRSRDPVGRLHRPRGRLDGPDRDRRARATGSSTRRPSSPGRRRGGPCRSAARRA